MATDKHEENDIARAIETSGEQVAAGLFAIAAAIKELVPAPADKLILTYTKRGQ